MRTRYTRIQSEHPAVAEAPELVVRRPLWQRRVGYLLAGAALAPVFLWTPNLRNMGWFLQSLCHEIGHCAVAWLAGCPAIPAISLTGHAMAAYSAQNPFLAGCVWFGLAALAWKKRDESRTALTLGLFAVVYPVFAFTGARDLAFLLAGHVGELAFAGYFFSRALGNGYKKERVVAATLGWFLVARNVWLSAGLLWSDAVRGWYERSGSFGLTNDYIRVAREVLHTDLSVVAGLMLIVSLVTLPLAWALARRSA